MQFKKIVLGSTFLILSGIMYEIDKALSYYKWAAYVIAINGNGGYNSEPNSISIFDNYFTLLFLITGIVFYINVGLSLYKIKYRQT
jgi:hypothetical protein